MHCIEVAFSRERLDSTGYSARKDMEEDLGIMGISKVRFTELYYIDSPFEPAKIQEIAAKVFIDPIVQKFSTSGPVYIDYDFYAEIRLHPDVTDNLGMTAQEAIEDYLGAKLEGTVRSAKRYYFNGAISRSDVEKICRQMLANGIIETFEIGGKNA